MNRKQKEKHMIKHVLMLLEAASHGDRTAQMSLLCLMDLIEALNQLQAELDQKKPKKQRRDQSQVIDLMARKLARKRGGDNAA